ncbi:TonB-dependent siderophore receptor [Acinetobacter sp. 1207_04]|uniref:TonB-dependent siderophore receptor n=1 Tax=Acinetobacter sp. 1207_04 TaxID=2604449 RepID=UPI0040580D91
MQQQKNIRKLAKRNYLTKMIKIIMLGATYVATTAVVHASDETEKSNVVETKILPTITIIANQLGGITENSGIYTPSTIATATRLVLKPRETPQTISVITRQEMDDFNLNSIDDVMRHTPGVSVVTYDSERTEYYSRGFAIQNFQYDGIPMRRDSAYSAGNTLSNTAIYDRIEVLKGATGLLTGVGDPGATINLIRKKPTSEFQGSASVGVGSWNTYSGEIDLSGPLNDSGTFRARGVAAYQDKESELDHYERKTPVFYGIVETDLTDKTLLTVGADYQDSKPEGSTWGGIPIYNTAGNFNKMPANFNNGARWSNWEQYTRTIFSTLEHKFDNDWVAKLQLNHQINGYDAQLGAAAGGNPNPIDGSGVSMWAGNYKGETKSNAADIYASGPFKLLGREHELVVGANISESTWKNNGYSAPNDYKTTVDQYYQWNGNVPEPDWQAGSHWTNKEKTKQNGLYVTSRLNLRDDLKLILGGRVANYESEDIKESGVFVPYIGTVYDLNDNYSLYASYSTIFSPQSNRDVNGKTLDPQEGENYEVGVKGEFYDGRLNASLAYYQLKQDNFAQEIAGVTTPSGDAAFEAIQGVKTKGVELEVTGEIMPDWNLHAGFNHKVSKQQESKVSTLTPENEFTLYTSYKVNQWVEGLTIGGGVRWQDETWGNVHNPQYTDPVKHTVSDYWLVDAMANYKLNDQLSFSFNVNNLLDEKYYTIFSWYSTYTWGEGRNYNLGLKYKF